jgi:hypothetical protein
MSLRRAAITVAAVATMVVAGSSAAPAGAADGGVVTTDVCLLSIPSVVFSPSVGSRPAPGTTITFHGSANCLSGAKFMPLYIAGTLYSNAGGVGCLAGSASGQSTIYSAKWAADAVTTTAVNHGGTWTLVFSKTGSNIVGGYGVVEQAAASSLACARGRVSSTVWSGAAFIVDPPRPEP